MSPQTGATPSQSGATAPQTGATARPERGVPEGAVPQSRARARALQAARYALKVPPVPRDFRTDIEGLRAIAVLGVMLWHAGLTLVPGGFVGVDVFFVLSGYLMTALLLEEGRDRGRIDIPRFYARRARRLLPASLTALLGTAVLTLLTIPPTRWSPIGADIAASAVYLVNWRMADASVSYLDLSRAPSPVQHYWSLAVEEQFYVLWPLLLLGLLLLARGRSRVFTAGAWALTLGLFALSLLASWWWTREYAAAAYFVTPTRIFELMLGAVVALGARAWPTIPRPMAAVLGWLGLGMIVVSLFAIDTDTPFPGTAALLPTTGAALVIIAGAKAGGWGPDVLLRATWMQWVGRLSYSLYLWHWPLLAAAASLARVGRGGPEALPLHWGILAVLVSVVPAWLSFRFVEEPVRRRGRVLRRVMGPGVTTWQTLRLGLNCSLAALAAGLVMMLLAPPTVTAQQAGWRTPAVVDALRAPVGAGALDPADELGRTALTAGQDLGAVGAEGSGDPSPTSPPAVTPPAPAPPPIPERVGDLAVPLEQVPDDVPVMEPAGCYKGLTDTEAGVCVAGDPAGAITVGLFGDSHAGMWVTALDEIGRDRGWRIVTVSRSSCPPTEGLDLPDGGPTGYARCLQYQEAAWPLLLEQEPDLVLMSSARYGAPGQVVAQALARRVDGLRDADVVPVLVRDVPRPDFDVPECLLDNRDAVKECAFDRTEGLAASGRGHEELAAMRPSLGVIDLTEVICPGPVCSPVVGDVVVWRDSNHLSATYIRSLRAEVEAQLLPWVVVSQLPAPATDLLLSGDGAAAG